MNEQKIEKELGSHLERFTAEFKKVAEGVLGEAYCNLLPYVLDDTLVNAKIQAEEIARDLISGRFKWDGDYVIVGEREYAPRIRIKFSSCQYDSMRDAIIERMPSCPKDAKIAALEDELRRVYERY